jgi:hypothetical protein
MAVQCRLAQPSRGSTVPSVPTERHLAAIVAADVVGPLDIRQL